MSFLPDFSLHISPLLSFGILLLFGVGGGFLAHKLSWLPSITGFILAGLVFGPHGLNVITVDTLSHLKIIIDVSLGLILYRLGLSLDFYQLLRSPKLLFVSLAECMLTFAAVIFTLVYLGVPSIVAALIAAIVISSSPAVLLHVADEVGAKGEVTDTATSLIALNNFIAFLMFTIILPGMYLSVDADWAVTILQPLYRLIGSLLIGIGVGIVLDKLVEKTNTDHQYKLALIIGAVMITLGLSQTLKLSLLFAPLVLGITVRTLERKSTISEVEFGSTLEIFFIILFVYAGAKLHISEIIPYAGVIFALVIIRSITKLLATTVIFSFDKKPLNNSIATGLLLIPMAGLAIGLAQTTSELFPVYAPTVSVIVLGAVAVLETLGPPLAVFAFGLAKESRSERENMQDS